MDQCGPREFIDMEAGGGVRRRGGVLRNTKDDSALVMDIQCFKDNEGQYLIKEACVIGVNTGTLLMLHVALAPFDRDNLTEDRLRESHWLTKHCHGLDWDQGDIPYHVLMEKLRLCLCGRRVVYVKGGGKKDFVCKQLLPRSSVQRPQVVDLGEQPGCASLTKLGNMLSTQALRCNRHKSSRHRCALSNCTLLREWLSLAAPPEPTAVLDTVTECDLADGL